MSSSQGQNKTSHNLQDTVPDQSYPSIYQTFKKNSHKILIDNTSIKNIKRNGKLNLIKNRINLNQSGRKSVNANARARGHFSMAFDTARREGIERIGIQQPSSINEIEQRILK